MADKPANGLPGARPMQGPFGLEVQGSDLFALPAAALQDAVHAHKLVVLRDQTLTPDALVAAAARLGELDQYPFAEPLPGHPYVVAVVKNPEDTSNFGGAWHSDTAYLPQPPGFTLLYAVELPERGGDTLFADMQAAYAALSPGLQRTLCGLYGHNSADLVHGAAGEHAAVAGQSVPARTTRQITHADHPVVRVHPATGARALYASLIHTAHFVGMSRPESLPLLRYLQQHAVAAERCARLCWQPGTLAIWDNRSLQHYPLNDYPGQRRVMHRVILRGESPIAA